MGTEALYERSEQDIVNNADIVLFAVSGRSVAVKPLPISRVDAWLKQTDDVFTMGLQVDSLGERYREVQQEYHELWAKFEASKALEMPHEAKEAGLSAPRPKASVTEEAVAQARERMQSVAQAWRERIREYVNAMVGCLQAYDERKLGPDVIAWHDMTDGQIISAFNRLRYFNDPLAMQQRSTANMLRARAGSL